LHQKHGIGDFLAVPLEVDLEMASSLNITQVEILPCLGAEMTKVEPMDL
jgi:hypothetical protein